MKIALSESEIWKNNFERQINKKLQALLKYSNIERTLDGKYVKTKPPPLVAKEPNTTDVAPSEAAALPVIALSTGECVSDRPTVTEASLKNNTLVTAPQERGPRKGLANGPSG